MYGVRREPRELIGAGYRVQRPAYRAAVQRRERACTGRGDVAVAGDAGCSGAVRRGRPAAATRWRSSVPVARRFVGPRFGSRPVAPHALRIRSWLAPDVVTHSSTKQVRVGFGLVPRRRSHIRPPIVDGMTGRS